MLIPDATHVLFNCNNQSAHYAPPEHTAVAPPAILRCTGPQLCHSLASLVGQRDGDAGVHCAQRIQSAPSSRYSQGEPGTRAGARDDGYDWVWADTCCIDKTSSAELTEAVNSMFRWYASAEVCYVLLSDVELDEGGSEPPAASIRTQLEKSAWFTRGWTLQEMLVPKKQIFYDSNWKRIGDREQEAFKSMIQSITNIDKDLFGNLSRIRSASVAEKMAWISSRQTSRLEDITYRMLGIFDVYMPLIYGEGMNAFRRPQREIIQATNDESIFAWSSPDRAVSGLLANHPRDFAGLVGRSISRSSLINRSPYAMTNKGLEFEIVDTPKIYRSQDATVPLNCYISGKGWVVLFLTNHGNESVWYRVHSHTLYCQNRVLDRPFDRYDFQSKDPKAEKDTERCLTVYVPEFDVEPMVDADLLPKMPRPKVVPFDIDDDMGFGMFDDEETKKTLIQII